MMASRNSMRLLLREHGMPGGVETVNIQLVREFTELVDRVVWVMPKSRFEYFQQFLPASDRLFYEEEYWPRQRWVPHNLEKAARFVFRQKNVPARFLFANLRQAFTNLRLRQIIRDHHITHCFYNWILHINAPRLGVPIGLMLMDVRWRYFPETFRDSDIETIECQFCEWLRKSSIVFPVSEATASDLKRFYPWYNGVTRVVPHGAQTTHHNEVPCTAVSDKRHPPLFYYPAGTQAHKNHLTLFEACAKLFAKGHDFEVVLTGPGIEHFDHGVKAKQGGRLRGVDRGTRLSDEVLIELCRAFLQREQALFRGRVQPRGYCDRAEVEALYKHCTAVVLPSFFEGFGLPLIEALQNGAEIICSDIPAYREQLTRYGCVDEVRLTPAGDATALAAEMEKVLIASRRPLWRKRLQSSALERWTWKDAAAAYIESLSALTPTDQMQ